MEHQRRLEPLFQDNFLSSSVVVVRLFLSLLCFLFLTSQAMWQLTMFAMVSYTRTTLAMSRTLLGTGAFKIVGFSYCIGTKWTIHILFFLIFSIFVGWDFRVLTIRSLYIFFVKQIMALLHTKSLIGR